MNEKRPGGPPENGKSNGSGGYGYGMPYGGGSPYGYGGYGAYGYGYGYGQGGPGGMGGDSAPARSFRDYLLILRERIWIFIVVFFIVFVGALLYHFQSPKIYQSSAQVRVLREAPKVTGEMKGQEVEDSTIRSLEDFTTEIRVLQSPDIISRVAARLDSEKTQRLIRPYENQLRLIEPTPQIILAENVSIQQERNAWIINVAFEHTNRDFCAEIANIFVDEFIQYSLEREANVSHTAVDDLNLKVTQQNERKQNLEQQLADYRKQFNMTDIDQNESLARQDLSQLRGLETERRTQYDEAKQQWDAVQEFKAEGEPLFKLPFIGADPRVSALQAQLSDLRVQRASLAERYRHKHPAMIELNERLNESQTELDGVIDQLVRQTEVSFMAARDSLDSARDRVAEQEATILELAELRVAYSSLVDELEVAKTLHQQLVLRVNQLSIDLAVNRPKLQQISEATPPLRPTWPKLSLNLAIGIIGGGVCGLGLVFVLAFFDDRVKSAHDVENVLGLPLVGVVPRMKGINSPEKARAVASNMDRRITEAFRGIHSSLRINELSKNAKTILSTSTVPSEGKSFVTTNLALTYAIHGEKVLVVDCDLRMPSVGKSLDLPETKGLSQVLEGSLPVDEAIYQDVYPNLDVLLAGGKSRNPTQALTSKSFDDLLLQLQEKYDRVIIDSPPIAAVSDALNMLQHVDGVIYLIKFNAVKRKTVKANIRRLVEANVPIFGAILNQISVAVSSYYYTNYYDKNYQDYYRQGEDTKELARTGAPDFDEAEPGEDPAKN
ncbi:MAG: GumC family protein [Opitutales bacterium]